MQVISLKSSDSIVNTNRQPSNNTQRENVVAHIFSFFGNHTYDIFSIILNYIENPNALNVLEAKRIQNY